MCSYLQDLLQIFFVGVEVIINITNISFKETPLRFVSGFYTFIRCHTDRYRLLFNSEKFKSRLEGRENLNLNFGR
jgi:hypothetical protein